VDAGRTPGRVFGGHAEDQFPNLWGDGSPPNPPAGVGDQPPVQAETNTVPPDNRLGCHDDQRLFPSRPETANNNPEQPIETTEARSWTSPFQYDKLLAQGEILEEKISTGTKEANEYSPTQEQILKHAERWVGTCRRELLDQVIALNEVHLRRLVHEYIRYYHEDRIHDTLDKDTPEYRSVERTKGAQSRVEAVPRVGGLHHRYTWKAAACKSFPERSFLASALPNRAVSLPA
jgi:Integrase core domain